jgi:short-subunit dehydrogenase
MGRMAISTPKRALVTGASGGLGAALARKLAARGIEVWLAARRKDALEGNAAAIRESGGTAHVLPMDLAHPDEVAKAVERLDDESGGIDLVIANAAVAGLSAAIPASRLTWSNTRDLLQINVLGNIATIVPLIPRMLARGHGHIVGISSTAALAPNPRVAPYAATKVALSYFLEGIGMELRPQGVAVTVVQPGFMRTPAAEGVKDPMPFILETDEAAAIIDRAIRSRRRKITFPWILAAISRAPFLFLPAGVREPLVLRATRERERG